MALERPLKEGNVRTYQEKVGLGYTDILASEADADSDTIYAAWNGTLGGDLTGTLPNPTIAPTAKSKWLTSGASVTPIDATKSVAVGAATMKATLEAGASNSFFAYNQPYVPTDGTKTSWGLSMDAAADSVAFLRRAPGAAAGVVTTPLSLSGVGTLSASGQIMSGATITAGPATGGQVRLQTSGTPYPGFVEFWDTGTRRGYMGYKGTGTAMQIAGDGGWTWEVLGSLKQTTYSNALAQSCWMFASGPQSFAGSGAETWVLFQQSLSNPGNMVYGDNIQIIAPANSVVLLVASVPLQASNHEVSIQQHDGSTWRKRAIAMATTGGFAFTYNVSYLAVTTSGRQFGVTVKNNATATANSVYGDLGPHFAGIVLARLS
jgi:hypothetical protein